MSNPGAHPAARDHLETWVLDHPDYGLIEVRSGFDQDFSAVDASWPGTPPPKFMGSPGPPLRTDGEAPLYTRLRGFVRNPPRRLEIRVDGTIQHQLDDIDNSTIPLFGPGQKERLTTHMGVGVNRAQPHLKIRANAFKDLLQVEFREGSTVVEFDPPEGSRGARRRQAMASSDFKRTVYPMAEGLGKGGWALAVLILSPLLGRFFARLAERLPDLPNISPPQVDLPVPELPHVTLPVPEWSLPTPNLPELPEWVQQIAEYAEIWLPVIAGIVIGIVALRNHRKSEQEKAAWARRESSSASADESDSDGR